MTAYRVTVAERKDLLVISVVCDECDTVVSLDLSKVAVPPNCSGCGKQYSEPLRKALGFFAGFLREAKIAEEQTGKGIFRFEIKSFDGRDLAP